MLKRATTVITGRSRPLSLKGKAAAPPLKVNSSAKVVNLDADTVDGLDSSAMANVTSRYSYTDPALQNGPGTYRIPAVPAGTYLVTLRTSLLSSPNTNLQCLIQAGGVDYAGDLAYFTGAYAAMISGADVMTLTQPTDVDVKCASNAFAYTFYSPLVVSLTRTTLATNGPLTKVP